MGGAAQQWKEAGEKLLKRAHSVNGQHCYALQEKAWIYEAEPDWAVNLMRLAHGRSLTPSSH